MDDQWESGREQEAVRQTAGRHTAGSRASQQAAGPADLYLDLLKRTLTRTLFEEEIVPVDPKSLGHKLAFAPLRWAAKRQGIDIVRRRRVDPAVREVGDDWPAEAETMIGLRRLDNIQELIRSVINDNIPGDFLEAGVWRGGASIFARAALAAYGDNSRTVWLADSFQGLPEPSLPQDEGDVLWTRDELAVSLEEVRRNFERYGLLDERVQFLVGWFGQSLPTAPIEKLAILRLDGDMYESTMDALSLYGRLSPGGYLIVDDYDSVEGCHAAIEDFRQQHQIDAPMVRVDWACVYWRNWG